MRGCVDRIDGIKWSKMRWGQPRLYTWAMVDHVIDHYCSNSNRLLQGTQETIVNDLSDDLSFAITWGSAPRRGLLKLGQQHSPRRQVYRDATILENHKRRMLIITIGQILRSLHTLSNQGKTFTSLESGRHSCFCWSCCKGHQAQG